MPRGTYPRPPVMERFWAKVDLPDANGCWLWTGALMSKGYGSFGVEGKVVRVHRFAYEQLVGPIPEGLHLDHLCRVRRCVNPTHLEPVTPRENNIRGAGWAGANARKTRCSHGHEFDDENTIRDGDGRRRCRTCARGSAA